MKNNLLIKYFFVSLILLLFSNDAFAQTMYLQKYNGTAVPKNLEGNEYPYWSDGRGAEGGFFIGSINTTDAVSGNSFKAHLISQAGTGNALYAQFNPYDGFGRDFARAYSENPSQWQFNTYNRMSFWMKLPIKLNDVIKTDGTGNANVGTYVKCIALPGCPDYYSDETGGGHFYHNLNLINTGTWEQVILNTHPDHQRGDPGGYEQPNIPHPTGESNYNYFDTLTRFYIQADYNPPPSLPADYLIDEIKFYKEPYQENDNQIRNIVATYVAATNRIILTWFRNKDENDVNHEVRYAFTDIHQSGWNAAMPAPNGIVVPPGWQGYNGMFYDNSTLPLSGKNGVYIAIKPLSNNPQGLFTQIYIPLNPFPSIPDTTPPATPTGLSIQ